jgi:hypothetical protein
MWSLGLKKYPLKAKLTNLDKHAQDEIIEKLLDMFS